MEIGMMEHLLSIVIPCYNSEDYMVNAIKSALSGGEAVEVIVVNDGSSDSTSEIGQKYESTYPGRVKLINKENGGHGDAVMTGINNSTGKYIKVLDSDDLLDRDALKNIVSLLASWEKENKTCDLLIANYVYCKEDSRDVPVRYHGILPEDEFFTWDEVGKFSYGTYLLMHSLIYRKDLLISCGLTLPKHTFYVDNIYAYYPLPHVETMYYVNENLYLYSIGRDDQSVNESVMISRIDQQIRVTELMRDMYSLTSVENNRLRDYLVNYLTIMYTVTTALLIESGSEENLALKKKLWDDFERKNFEDYELVHKNFLGWVMSKEGSFWNGLIHSGYKISQKVFHFN